MIQLQVLNKVLSTKDFSIITKNNLNYEFFSDYIQEYNFILEHYNKYGSPPDYPTLLYKFPEFQVVEVNESNDYLLDELYKDKNTRDLASTFSKIRELIMSGDINKAMQVFKSSSEKISTNKNITSVDIIRDTSRYDAYIERTKDFTKYYIKTGFDELDKLIGGWDREEELATIVARTNVGKSFILIKCALAAAQQGLNVGLYSGEMSEKKVGYRVDTLLSHISNGSLVHGNADIKLEYKEHIESLPSKVSGKLKVLTPTMVGEPIGVSSLRSFIEKENLDILFVDQHSLLEDDRKGKNAVDRASNISRDLKNLQVLKKIPIISVSQQNREKNDGNLDTTQIAQSDRIGQDSTLIIFLEKKDDTMKLHLVKSRDTANGKVLTYFVDFNLGEFRFIPEEDTMDLSSEEYENRYNVEGGDVF